VSEVMDGIVVEHCEEVHCHKGVSHQAQMHLPRTQEVVELAELFKVFGDVTRIRILCVLSETEMCVCDLADTLEMTQSAISHQLRVLKQMKLVSSRREGKTVFYSLADGHITTIVNQGMEHIRE
jgi:DNA-binding transcriptional ArsR family regulator